MATAIERRLQRIESRLEVLEAATGVVPALDPWEAELEPIPRTPPVPFPPSVPVRARRDVLRPTSAPFEDSFEDGLEGETRIPQSAEPVSPEPLPLGPTAREPRPEKAARDWERFFGMAVLGRVGVAAVLLAAGYFAKLAYDTMSDGLKVASIYLLAGGFFATGWFLRERVARRYLALLWGGAAAAAYLAGLAAHVRYGLVDTLGGLAMLLGASLFGQALARRLRHETLASIALAGAFAAPLFVVFPIAERAFPLDPTFLLVYLMTLYGWSAWVERAWGWSSARLTGLVGTVVVVVVWLWQAGGLNASTYDHLHIYLLGLALPELIAAVTGRGVSRERQLLIPVSLAVAEALLLLAVRGPFQVIALPAFTTSAGVAWLTIALSLSFTSAQREARMLVRGLGRLGGVMLAFGLLHFSEALLGTGTAAEAAWTVVGLSALCGALLGLRLRLGVGELGATLAATLAMATVLQQPQTNLCLQLLPVALAAAAALVVFGRARRTRGMGVWLGLTLTFLGVMRAADHHVAWQAGALIAASLWLAGGMAWGRRRTLLDLEQHGLVGLWVVGALWALLAFVGQLKDADLALANPATVAAAVIAVVAAWGALSHRRPKKGRPVVAVGLWILCIATLLLAGHRETAEAVEGLAKPIRDALHVVYLALAGIALAALGGARGVRGLSLTGGALVLAGVGKMLFDGLEPPLGAWPMLELLAPVGALLLIVRRARRADALLLLAAVAGLCASFLGWCLYVLEDRLPADWVLFNVRFATGALLLLAGLALPPRLFPEAYRRKAGLTLLASTVVLGYVVGLAELLQAVKPLAGQGAWSAIFVSLYTTLFSAGLLIAGFLRRAPALRYAALIGFGAAILKVGLYDLASAALPLRILVTGVLGLVLLAAAFAYARRSGAREASVEKAKTETLPG